MGGNVWQWCEDWYDSDQTSRVLRGASWNGNSRDGLLSSARESYSPSARHADNGFRCVPWRKPEHKQRSLRLCPENPKASAPQPRPAKTRILLLRRMPCWDTDLMYQWSTIDSKAAETYLRNGGKAYALRPGSHSVEVAYSFGFTHSVKPSKFPINVKPGHFYAILADVNPTPESVLFSIQRSPAAR